MTLCIFSLTTHIPNTQHSLIHTHCTTHSIPFYTFTLMHISYQHTHTLPHIPTYIFTPTHLCISHAHHSTCSHITSLTHSHSLTPSTYPHICTHTHSPAHPGGQPLVDVLSGVGGWAAANITQDGPWNYSELTVDQIAGSQAFFAFSVGADPENSTRQTIFVSAPERCAGVGDHSGCIHMRIQYIRMA